MRAIQHKHQHKHKHRDLNREKNQRRCMRTMKMSANARKREDDIFWETADDEEEEEKRALEDGWKNRTMYKKPTNQSVGSIARLEKVNKRPLFTIALFADAQYANKDDAVYGSRTKHFRAAKGRLLECLKEFRANAHELSAIISLGDIYDGYNDDDTIEPYYRDRTKWKQETNERNYEEFMEMVRVIEESKIEETLIPFVHALGNHDMSVGREVFKETLKITSDYYTLQLPRNWKLIVLDTTDLNPRYLDESSAASKEGREWLRTKSEEFLKRNAKPWSGGLAREQFEWLKDEITIAERLNQRVIVASHNALSPGSAREGMVAWNCLEICSFLESKSEIVKVCLAGHDHPGGYINRGNVHYCTIEAMLESDVGTSFGYLDVYEHECILRGVGACQSRRMRTANFGEFTGIANFGMLTGDIIDNDDDRKQQEMPLADWINKIQIKSSSSSSSSSSSVDGIVIE